MMLADLLLGTLAVALLTLPGWWLARAWRMPQPALAGFVGGAVVLTNLIVALDALHARLSPGTLGGAWLGATAIAVVLARQRNLPASATTSVAWREHWPLLVPLVPALAVVAYRAIAQPLSGIDTIFRWDWLARAMLARETLAFYPPVTGADYEVYAWPDGIAPTVSSLYFFAYTLARTARPVLTAPVVVAQFALLLVATFALARKYFSDRAAALALALLAASPLVLWGVAMGQETGLTALSVVALLLWLPRAREEETLPAIVAAGLAAALGALAREYGLAWIFLGLALGFARRLSPRALALFAAVAALGALPWYARNWLRTGNPLFDLDLAGLFPVNTAHAWLVEGYQREFGWSHLPPEAPRLLVTHTLLELLGGGAGAWWFFRRSRALLGAAALVVAIWAASLGFTAAGFIYALRVLAPALALGAVLGGAAAARWLPTQRHLAGASVALALLATDSALRALVLPSNLYRVPPAAWLSIGGALQEIHTRPLYHDIAQHIGTTRILTLGPNTLLAAQGARTVPLWSPEVRFLFDPTITALASAHRLRALGIGFVFLTKGPSNERYLARSAFFRDPGDSLQALWSDPDLVFLKLTDGSK
jgi:hypothetical protein